MAGPDRKNALASQTDVTGIDFVYVAPDQVTLAVFFLTDPLAITPTSLITLIASQIRIHADMLADVPIVAMAWGVADNRNVLQLTTAAPGGFAPYQLLIDDPRIDPFFNDVSFSFKANCPSELDCEAPPPECPPEAPVDFPVDPLARDFWSIRRALLDYASQRYPDWKDRLEADLGVILVEVMSHLGDEMAYYQDRIAREALLEGASERRSLRRHARLVDYVVHDGLGAQAWLDVQVASAAAGPQMLAAGTDVWAESDSGTIVNGVFTPRRVPFEVGRGLAEVLEGKTYAVDTVRNALSAHIWDETSTCLAVGTTELWIDGHHAADLPLDDAPPDAPPGRWVMIQTAPTDPSLPARRHAVRLIAVTDETDPLGALLGTDTEVTHLVWEPAQALPFEMDLEHRLTVHGNVVPVTAGRTQVAQFSIGPCSLTGVPRAVERTGANGSVAFVLSLPDPDGDGLVWLSATGDPRTAAPEAHLTEATFVSPNFVAGERWTWRRSLIGTESSHPEDTHFTLDDGTWTRVVGYQRLGGEIVHQDYQTGAGVSLRFGDGEFGRVPAKGSGDAADDELFQVTWRVGNGARGNVPAESITEWDRADPSLWFLGSIENPRAATGGLDPESALDIKKLAPDAFRAVTYRAVRPEDYAEAAERLPWVERAGGAFRFTGSWLSAFVTADPRDTTELSEVRRLELTTWLDRFRQAGREVFVQAPRYADIDLVIRICVESSSYPADVIAAVMQALFGRSGAIPVTGFFDPDNFTFGTPLDRSQLEATIQRVPGVRAVERIAIRRRGWFTWRPFAELVHTAAPDEVIRVEQDRLHPERGTVRVTTEGGA